MIYDLFQAQKSEGERHCKSFILWPEKWRAFNWPKSLFWNKITAKKSNIKRLPEDTGVYAFVVCPNVAQLTSYGIVVYVGETKGAKQTLRKRCAVYFRESEYVSRPHIGEMMNLWANHLQLFYAQAPAAEVAALEAELLLAFAPPFNRKFPGTFNKVASSIYHS